MIFSNAFPNFIAGFVHKMIQPVCHTHTGPSVKWMIIGMNKYQRIRLEKGMAFNAVFSGGFFEVRRIPHSPHVTLARLADGFGLWVALPVDWIHPNIGSPAPGICAGI